MAFGGESPGLAKAALGAAERGQSLKLALGEKL